MIYSTDYDTLEDREIYRKVIIESKNEEWHRKEIQRFHIMDNIQLTREVAVPIKVHRKIRIKTLL